MIAMNASVVEAGCGWRGSWAAELPCRAHSAGGGVRCARTAQRRRCSTGQRPSQARLHARHRHRALGRGGAMCGGGGCRAMPPIVGFCPRCAPSCPAVQMRAGGRDHSEVARAATMYAPDLCQSTRATPNLVARHTHSTMRRVKPQAAPTWSFVQGPAWCSHLTCRASPPSVHHFSRVTRSLQALQQDTAGATALAEAVTCAFKPGV